MTLVPPMSNVVIETSPATVNSPSASVSKSVSDVCPIVVPLISTLSTVTLPAAKSPAVTDILPVDVPVAVVVPTKNPSFDSSQIRAALSPVDPRSNTNPKSFAFEPAPVLSSIRGSACVSTVDDAVNVVPDTVRLPPAVILPLYFLEMVLLRKVYFLKV